MGERINRLADEKIYQPRIHSSLIHEINLRGEITSFPIAVIVDRAIRENLGKYEMEVDQCSQPINPKV